MRLALDPRARRLLRRLPRTTVYSVLELLLLSLLAVQCARLVWALVTPLGPVGDWKAPAALRPVQPVDPALLADFDPFFRTSPGAPAPAVVTTLNLKLFGVREDRASGRGSAIVGLPDGQQRSFAVGEEIMPGVTLAAVGFDNVTVSRGGASEQLFLDQSSPATTVGAPGANTPTTAAPGTPPPLPVVVAPPREAPPPPPSPGLAPPPQVQPPVPMNLEVNPRLSGGRINGVTVQRAEGAAAAAGLRPGDVVTSVGGRPVTSIEGAMDIYGAMGRGGTVVQVERNGRTVDLRVRSGQ